MGDSIAQAIEWLARHSAFLFHLIKLSIHFLIPQFAFFRSSLLSTEAPSLHVISTAAPAAAASSSPSRRRCRRRSRSFAPSIAHRPPAQVSNRCPTFPSRTLDKPKSDNNRPLWLLKHPRKRSTHLVWKVLSFTRDLVGYYRPSVVVDAWCGH